MSRTRLSVDAIQLGIASLWAQRATCARTQVGCVVTRDGRTLASGYNGTPAGQPHCTCEPPDAQLISTAVPCTSSVHAEANAIAFAARYGIALDGTTMYSTHSPCRVCAMLIINAGIYAVMYVKPYRDPEGINILRLSEIEVTRFNLPENVEVT